jgi:hypothetical protein
MGDRDAGGAGEPARAGGCPLRRPPPEERRLARRVLGRASPSRPPPPIRGGRRPTDPLLAGQAQGCPRCRPTAAPERGQYGSCRSCCARSPTTRSRRDRRPPSPQSTLEQSFEGAEREVPEVIAAHLPLPPSRPDDPVSRRSGCAPAFHSFRQRRARGRAGRPEELSATDQAAVSPPTSRSCGPSVRARGRPRPSGRRLPLRGGSGSSGRSAPPAYETRTRRRSPESRWPTWTKRRRSAR